MPDLDRTIFESSLVKVVDYRCAGSDQNREEAASEHEIILPRSGVYLHRDARGVVLADANQVLFFNQAQPYEITHPAHGGDHSTVFILSQPFLLEMLRGVDASVEERLAQPFTRSAVTLDTPLSTLQYWLLRTANQPMLVDPLEVEEQLVTFLAWLLWAANSTGALQLKGQPTVTLIERHQLVQQVRLYLHEHLADPINLGEIAASVFISPYHLCRIFKGATGKAIHQYLKHLRLFTAAEQLAEYPHAPIDALAVDYGFASHSHFSTAFLQLFGTNPATFQRTVNGARLTQMRKILKV